ncbi:MULTISPECIES: hypothetical protein [Helicobacter]|uniref:hypothetical protein n=3 Tax=Helicobacteraceae TaxID=72293 RepID=UPI0025B79CBD|nr:MULTISPECIES: hypothetical protein [Helicobacter]
MTHQQERLLREIYYIAKRYTLNNDLRAQPIRFDIQENSQIKMNENNLVFEIKDLLYLEIQGYVIETTPNLPHTIFVTITEKGMETIKNLGFDYVVLFQSYILSQIELYIDGQFNEFIEKLKGINCLALKYECKPFNFKDNNFYIGSIKPEFLESLKKCISFNNQTKSIKEHMQDIIDSNDNKKGEELWEKIKILSF